MRIGRVVGHAPRCPLLLLVSTSVRPASPPPAVCSELSQCNRSRRHPEGWYGESQLLHYQVCKGLYAAAVPPPTVVQA
eukprot:153445-Pelagomonas_calceolata.AAC.2